MDISYSTAKPLNTNSDLLAIPVYGDPRKDALAKAVDELLEGRLFAEAELRHFQGKLGQLLSVATLGTLSCKVVALVGGGSNKNDAATCRNIGGNASRLARSLKVDSMALVLPAATAKQLDHTGQMTTEGVALGAYKFTKYLANKESHDHPTQTVTIHADRSTGKKKGPSSRTLKSSVERAVTVAAATCHARDMVNEPAEFLNPSQVATIARAIAKRHDTVTCKVLGPKECQKMGMGLFLGVGRGSDREPRFIHLTYKPKKKAKKVLTFIGKGVTFDAGGYSLKPSAAMLDMKIDMGGCAAVVSAMDAIATLGSPHEVHVITACCENLVSGNAYFLGDVLRGMDGTTVEINNTDAEGRLTLADAIAYARKNTEPDELFDFATLTGAIVVALGDHTTGVFSNDSTLAKRWMKAADSAGEDMWQLPLNRRLKKGLKSSIADMKNTGPRPGGAITAALFLSHFVKDTKWVHCDIAGPAFGKTNEGATVAGATGVAVASIVEYATRS